MLFMLFFKLATWVFGANPDNGTLIAFSVISSVEAVLEVAFTVAFIVFSVSRRNGAGDKQGADA